MNYKVRAIVGFLVVLANLGASGFEIYSDGPGRISPDFDGIDGKNMVGGRIYTISARPFPGFFFYAWHFNGDYLTSRVLQIKQVNGTLYVKEGAEFIPSSDGVLFADFGQSPFIPGTYIGISHSGKPAEMKLQLSRQGSFSGNIRLEGKSYPLSGKYPEVWTTTTTFQLSSNLVAAVTTYFDVGDIYIPPNIYVSFDWGGASGPFDHFECQQMSFHSDADVRKQLARKYTMTIANEDYDSLPRGDGFATLTVTRSGGVRVVGKLPDGVPFTQGSSITDTLVDTLKWPFFISLNKGGETASGWMQMYPGDWSEVSGGPFWQKLPQTNASTYPDGFLGYVYVEGSSYEPPGPTNQILGVTNLLVSYDGGTLPIHFVNPAILTSDNKIVATNGNQQTFKIQPQTGLFTGTATPPGQTQPISFQGVLIQNLDWCGSGFFLQDKQSGRVTIEVPLP